MNTTQQEQLSALFDGQLSAEQTRALLQTSLTEPVLLQAWQGMSAVSSHLASPAHRALHPAPSLQSVSKPAAANDAQYRWKMLAGICGALAVGSLSWALLGSQGKEPSAVLAAAPIAPNSNVATSAAIETAPVMIRDPRLDQLLAAHKQLGAGSALSGSAGALRSVAWTQNQSSK